MTTSEKSSENKSVLKIIADYDCEVIIDKKKSIKIIPNAIHRISIRKGRYVIEIIPKGYPQLSLNKTYVMESNGMEDVLEIKLKDTVANQKDKEDFLRHLSWDYEYIEDLRTGVKITLSDNLLIKCRFDSSQYFKVLQGAKKVCKEREYFESVIGYRSFYFTDIEGGTAGVVDAFGRTIIDCIYKNIKFWGKAFLVQNFDDLWEIINIDETSSNEIHIYHNRWLLGNTFQDCADYIEGATIIPIKNNHGKWGAVDYQGSVVIEFNYDGVVETDKYYAFGNGCEVYKSYDDYSQSYDYKELKCSKNGCIQRCTLDGELIEDEKWEQVIIEPEQYGAPMWVDSNGNYFEEIIGKIRLC